MIDQAITELKITVLKGYIEQLDLLQSKVDKEDIQWYIYQKSIDNWKKEIKALEREF